MDVFLLPMNYVFLQAGPNYWTAYGSRRTDRTHRVERVKCGRRRTERRRGIRAKDGGWRWMDYNGMRRTEDEGRKIK